MALVLKDRVRETSTTSGTGTIVLAGAVAGFQSFSAIGNANTTYYCIADSSTGGWEVGIGTYTSSGTTLSRTTVLASSNSGALVAFSANVKDVFCTYPAGKSANVNAALTSGRVTFATTDGLLTDSAGLTFDGTNFTTTGTATAAKLIPTGTSVTGNGMYLPATNSVGISTAGTNAVYIDASQNVGIGTNSFNSVRSVIQGTQTGGAPQTSGTAQTYGILRLQGTTFTSVLDFGTNGGNYNWIQATDSASLATNYSLALNPNGGNVGIGTSSPGVKLDVNGALRVGVASNPTTIASNSQFYDQSGIGPTISGYNFEVRTGNPTPSARMIVDSAGNVGIGTSSPTSILNVKSASPIFRLETTGTVSSGGVAYNSIRDSTGSDVFINGYAGLANCYQFGTIPAAGFMRFLTGAQVEAMRIDSSGNVGIGTSSPAGKLEVSAANGIVYSTGTAGFGSFYARGSGTNNSYIFMGNATSGEQGRITVENGGAITFGNTASATERMRIDSAGQVGIGFTPYATQGNLQVYKALSGGAPATSGSTDANQVASFVASSVELSIGAYATGTMWIQPRLLTDFSTNFSLNLLPNGGNLGIGTVPNASAILDAQSTTKGVRMPNMTTTQKNAIASPPAGLIVFDTTLAKLAVYSGSAWQTITSV